MIWRLATHTAEDWDKGDGSPYTWIDYANKMTSMIVARHNDANIITCVNDPYRETESTESTVDETQIDTYPRYVVRRMQQSEGHILCLRQ